MKIQNCFIFKLRSLITGSLLIFNFLSGTLIEAQIGGGAAVQESRPVKPVEFLGYDYARLGYSINPGEDLALLFQNSRDSIAKFTVFWTLSTYQGQFLTEGKTDLNIGPKQTGQVRITLPADIKDGSYMIHYTPDLKGWGKNNPFYFDYRKAVADGKLSLNLVTLIENMDPEGWVRMMLGPMASCCNVWKNWPSNSEKIDAVIVIAEGITTSDPKFTELQNYLKMGGTALVFGKPAPALAELLPVIVDNSSWAKQIPLKLKIMNGAEWQDFNPSDGPEHYGINFKAKESGKILAEWSDGTPAVVSGSYGKGKVIYVGSGSGQVWQKKQSLEGADELALRLLYSNRGGEAAVKNMIAHADLLYRNELESQNKIRDKVSKVLKITPPKEFVVVGRHNIGRFGWINDEGGLTENINANGKVTVTGIRDWQMRGGTPMLSDPIMTFSIEAGNSTSPEISGVRQNWFSKTIDWKYPDGQIISSTLSLGTPGMLWEGKSSRIGIGCKNVTHIAFETDKGIKIIKRGEGVNVSGMTENWILAFTAEDKVQDMPQLFVLTRKPKSLIFDDGIRLDFGSGSFGAFFTSRLWGIRRLEPGKTIEWIKGIPENAITDARRWSRAFLDFPVDCDEIGWTENKSVIIADNFVFRTFGSEWKTKPLRLTVIPPVYILAKNVGAPVRLPANLTDLNCSSNLGPITAVEGEASLVSTDIPPQDHRAIIPVEGKMIYQNEIDYRAGGLGFGQRSSPPGRNEGGGNFHVDIDEYENPGHQPYNLQACIDPYKWWYTFNALLARPVYSAETREKVDNHNRLKYWETLNFYSHKCMVVQKREPFTSNEYLISFVWPTQTQFGYRNFNDANEASGLIAYSYTNYARYYGDWTTIRSNWNHCRRLYEYLPKVNDWACLSSGALEYWFVAGLDMLNSEPYGNFAFSYAAGLAGYPHEALQGIVLGTRSLIPTVARLGIHDYLMSITSDGDMLRSFQGFYHFGETGLFGSKRKMGGVGLFDTSKGTMHELLLGYKTWTPVKMTEELKAMGSGGREGGMGGGSASPDNSMRILLGWDIETYRKPTPASSGNQNRRALNWQSTTSLYDLAFLCVGDIPFFLSDWAPSEYISGSFNLQTMMVKLKFQSHLGEAFKIKIYSLREPVKLLVNGQMASDSWKYDSKTGWLEIILSGDNIKDLIIQLGDPVAPLHPYFTRKTE
jgi:hypothetical protein